MEFKALENGLFLEIVGFIALEVMASNEGFKISPSSNCKIITVADAMHQASFILIF